MKLKNSFNSYLVGEVMKTKIEIVTGFLGSGKTAFLNALIKETIVMERQSPNIAPILPSFFIVI